MGNIKCLKGSGPLIGMLVAQVIATGMQILSKMVLSEGLFVYTLLTYRCLIAAVCMVPFAFFLEKDSRAKLNFTVVFWVLCNSLAGCTMAIGLFYFGLRDTTATYATNFLNLIPIVTFILSLLLRMAKLNLNTRRGKVRVIGALLSVAGALIIILYKGKIIHMESNLIHPHHQAAMIVHKVKKNWTRGTLLLLVSCLSYAAWFIVQAKLLKAFPFKYSATMLTCLAGAIQAAVIGVCIDRKVSSWALGWNLQLVAILYSGVLASAVAFYLISWAVAIKGPTYPAIFNPLSVIFVAILEALLLGEDLSVGSVIGMAVIIIGVYAFLWGTGGDRKRDISLPKAPIGGIEGGGEGQRDGGSMLQFTAIVVPIDEAEKKHSVH